MAKANKNEPRKIDYWSDGDLDFPDNWTKKFAFDSPYGLERRLERLGESLKHSENEPGLLEFILREFENEGKKILDGLDSEKLMEVWRTFFDVKDFGRLRLHLEYNFPSLLSPLLTSMQLQNAAHVAFCADRVRTDISNGDAEQTAIDMLKLCFTTTEANLHEIITRGIRARRMSSSGGKTSQRRRGIDLAIDKIFKGQDAFSGWLYFAENHYGYEKALEIKGYKIFFIIDIQGLQQDRISKRDAYRRGRLSEIFQDDDKTQRGIKLPTFRQYFSEARKKIMSK